MKANQTRQNGRNYKKALCGYAAMGAVMILGASGGALLAVQAAETETETVLTGEVQMSAADLLLGVGGELIVGVGPESNIQIKAGYQVRCRIPGQHRKFRKSERQ